MKILSISQIKEADAFTIKNEPVPSADLMERAAEALARWFLEKFPRDINISIFAGSGNNGGDGLALGRLLSGKGIRVDIFQLFSKSGYSPDTAVNLGRLKVLDIPVRIISSKKDFPRIAPSDIIVDALFGTGLSRPVSGLPASLIDYLNESPAGIVSIDIPSGLFGDDNRNNPGTSIIRAQYTLSFQFPKLAFLFPENSKYTGQWEILPIGLHQKFIDEVKTVYHYVDSDLVKPLIRPRNRFSHKGNFGHCLLIAGSYGKMGAAVLSATSCLRSGTGLLTAHVPVKGCEVVQTSIPEAMVSLDDSDVCFTRPPSLDQYDAVAAGPALGIHPASQKALYDLLKSVRVPLVLDADAINIISRNKEWLGILPENTILTPHPGEFDRLAGQHKNSHDRLISQLELAKKYKIIIVLKVAYTSVSTPGGLCFFNGSGNPGMATAGSGDVLTGIILSLLGQGFKPADAAVAGTFIHGMAGDLASARYSQEAMIAGDISANLGKVFKLLKK
jgi:ADP-dependent NAD(P)H-hydrate dehydratase / NAD(P)H-hydrate epimerase